MVDLDSPRAVIVISSHVARGSVGNRAAVFALETLGHPVLRIAISFCRVVFRASSRPARLAHAITSRQVTLAASNRPNRAAFGRASG